MINLSEIVLNPVRMRIVQALATAQNLTTSALCEKLPDVPRTTLYRHVNVLLDSGVATVVSEKKIRGSVERTIALNIDLLREQNTLENATAQAFAFLMNRYTRYQEYFQSERADPGRDKIFLNATVMMLDDDEFDRFLNELRELFVKYSLEAKPGRRPRDISILSTPVESE